MPVLFWFGGMDGLFSVIPVLVIIGFIVVLGSIIVRGIQGASRWQRNNASPVLTVAATVVAKRANTQHYAHSAGHNGVAHATSSTTYYVTFEFASGDRMEFVVRGTEHGMLAERDAGNLTFQGTRYLGFTRAGE